jgi:hypothetical protein
VDKRGIAFATTEIRDGDVDECYEQIQARLGAWVPRWIGVVATMP